MMMNAADALQMNGVAQVLVYLKPAQGRQTDVSLSQADRRLIPRTLAAGSAATSTMVPLAARHVSSLKKFFTPSALSQDGALAACTKPTSTAQRKSWQTAQTVRFYPNLGILLGNVDYEGWLALRQEATVSKVEVAPQLLPILPIRPLRASAPSRSKVTWGIRQLRIEKLWKEGLTGQGVLVGHLDTGVAGGHATFKHGAIQEFAEFDRLGVEVSPSSSPHDTQDHGTHTAATIVGRPVSGKHVGVAYGAGLASAIVIEGGNLVARVLAGMDWCVGHRVRVLNMSLGFPGYWPNFLPLTRILRRQHVLPVFAVGNEGPGTSRSPGNYAAALSVGALGRQGRVADFSSSQEFQRQQDGIVPDLVAPGVDVYSAQPRRGYQSLSGSSMAAPHVSGLAALLLEARPEATVDEIERAIRGSCDSTGIDPTRGGGGVPDGPRALDILLGNEAATAPEKKSRQSKSNPRTKRTK